MNKKAELINICENNFPIVNKRFSTMEELKAKESFNIKNILIKEIVGEVSNNYELGKKVLENKIMIEPDIVNSLNKNKNYRNARVSKTPKALLKYQKNNDNNLREQVNKEIQEHGLFISKGQELFHGGLPNKEVGDIIITDRVLSTSLNPYVARQNGLHNCKAYDDGELTLNYISIQDENIKGIFLNNRTNHGHEKEVILEKNLEMKVVSKIKISDIQVSKDNCKDKTIPVYLEKLELRKFKDKKN